ncbi:MAG: hypothetical protein RL242_3306, partial [Pseudomonadota bacterium]
MGEGGPRQWWVREFCEWKSEEIEQFEVAPHPAFSHLLPEGEGKECIDFFSPNPASIDRLIPLWSG